MLIILITTLAYSYPVLTCGVTQALEAEDATLSNAGVKSRHKGYTGKGYVTFTQRDSYLEWSVFVECPGNAKYTVRFANAGRSNRPMEIKVNNAAISNVDFPQTRIWTIKSFCKTSTMALVSNFQYSLLLLKHIRV